MAGILARKRPNKADSGFSLRLPRNDEMLYALPESRVPGSGSQNGILNPGGKFSP